MHELYSDDYASLGGGRAAGLISERLRRALAAAVFVGLVVGMGVWAYRLGTRDAAEVPIIRAMEGPTRIQPEDPGGARAAYQGLEVNTVLSGEPAPVPRAGDPADASAASRLVAEALLAEEDAPQGELEMTAVPASPDSADDPAQTDAPVPLQEDLDGVALIEPAPELRPAELVAAESEAASEDASAGAAESDESETLVPAEAGPRPRSRPAGLRVASAAPVAAPAAPVAAEASESAAAVAAPATSSSEVNSVPSGSRLVQLGAFDSAEITRQAWEALVARHGDLLGSKNLYVERTTANARVFYRLRVAGFESTDELRQMCEALRGRGVDCIPVVRQ